MVFLNDWPVTKSYSSIEVYDPVEDSWSTLSSPGGSGYTHRWGAGTCMCNGLIYVIGGNPSKDYVVPGETVPSLDIVEVYNPVTNSWTQKASMPTARFGLAAVAVENKIYAIGGASLYPPREFTPIVEVYDPATETWEKLGNTPRDLHFTAAVEQDGIIYLPGYQGQLPSDEFDIFYTYDPACDSKTK